MKDASAYRDQLTARLDPSALLLQRITASVRANPKRVAFAEGEEECVIRAAAAFQNAGLGKALLIGRADVIKHAMHHIGIENDTILEICVPHSAKHAQPYIDALYETAAARRTLPRLRADGDQRPQHLCGFDGGGGRCRRE